MNENQETNPSRRQFLTRTGRGAAVSALAGVALPPVHAAGSDTIHVALVGCGGRGTGAAMNALGVKNGGIKLVAMADVVVAPSDQGPPVVVTAECGAGSGFAWVDDDEWEALPLQHAQLVGGLFREHQDRAVSRAAHQAVEGVYINIARCFEPASLTSRRRRSIPSAAASACTSFRRCP